MATKKICLDSGHFGKYNQSPVVKTYYESCRMWDLHLLLKAELEAYGFEVITTRPTLAKDLGLYDRGAKSKGCDLFLSLHSNATGNSSGNENIDYPVTYVPLNGKGDELGQKLATCVQETMQTTQKGRIATRKSSSGGEYYGVIRGAVAVGTVGMILEHSFHTNTRSTNWLLKDENLKKLAQNEAKVIAEYFGVKKTASTTTSATKELYRVRKTWADAKSQLFAGTLEGAKRACKEGYSVYDSKGNCVYTNGEFKVRVTIKDLNIREKASASSKSKGYIEPGVYTIIKVDGKWGFLKSQIGWIHLDYTERL